MHEGFIKLTVWAFPHTKRSIRRCPPHAAPKQQYPPFVRSKVGEYRSTSPDLILLRCNSANIGSLNP